MVYRDRARLQQMRDAMQSLARPQAAQHLASLVNELAGKNADQGIGTAQQTFQEENGKQTDPREK